jgi:hypothetical protein
LFDPDPFDSRVAQRFVPAIVIYRLRLTFTHVVAALLVFATASVALAGSRKKPSPTPKPTATPPPLIEVTGSILGVALFTSLEEAREKMKAFKLEEGSAAESSEKEEREAGERMIWRLAETEYLWIVAWADKEGKIVKISASTRSEKRKPFREIGDLTRAKTHDDSMAMWIARHPDGTYFRVVAKGPGEKASSIYLYSLKPEPIN